MKITKDNIEVILFDYAEGDLSPKEQKEVEDFLENNPQYKQMLSSYSDEEKKRDEIMYQKMLDLAIKDSNDPNNYKNSMDRLNSK